MRTRFKIALAVAIAFVIAVVFLIDVIPPRSLTVTNMSVTKRRILEYTRQYGHLPPDLSDLPPMANGNTSTVDGWGHPLHYSFDSSGVVTLRSAGIDKLAGSQGSQQEIIGIFPSRDERGNSLDEFVRWAHDPATR